MQLCWIGWSRWRHPCMCRGTGGSRRRQAGSGGTTMLNCSTCLPSMPARPLPCVQGDTSGVGSVIKCGEEDDPVGVSTVLALGRYGDAAPLQELRTFLLAAAGEYRQRLEQVREQAGSGPID